MKIDFTSDFFESNNFTFNFFFKYIFLFETKNICLMEKHHNLHSLTENWILIFKVFQMP